MLISPSPVSTCTCSGSFADLTVLHMRRRAFEFSHFPYNAKNSVTTDMQLYGSHPRQCGAAITEMTWASVANDENAIADSTFG